MVAAPPVSVTTKPRVCCLLHTLYPLLQPLQASAEAQHGTHFLRQLGRLPARSLGTDDDPISNTPAGGAIHYDPCIGDAVTKYLNNPAVQKAIHANTTLGYPWSSCSPRVNYSRKDLLTSVIPVYQNLMKVRRRSNVYIMCMHSFSPRMAVVLAGWCGHSGVLG